MSEKSIELNAQWVRSVLPKRRADDHKGRFGSLGILAGSARYRGAALLAADGALRCGAGIVQLASTEKVCAAAAVRLPCCTLLPLAETPGGGIAPEGAALLASQKHSALLAGCGLGNTAATAALVKALLSCAACPLVLDADALNVLAGHVQDAQTGSAPTAFTGRLAALAHPPVLTPHPGEMARLCGASAGEILQNTRRAALRYAAAHRCVVALKSHVTLVAEPGGRIAVNSGAGNPGLAKGGSGDVLAGVIAGLLAQGLPAFEAAAAGVWLHAAAADKAAQAVGMAGLSPAQLPEQLALVQKELGF